MITVERQSFTSGNTTVRMPEVEIYFNQYSMKWHLCVNNEYMREFNTVHQAIWSARALGVITSECAHSLKNQIGEE